VIAPLPFRASVLRYSVLRLPLGAVAAWIAWDGAVTRSRGALLVALYVLFVVTVWVAERRPPALGEVHELEEAEHAASAPGERSAVGRELLLLLVGIAAMAAGASLLVEAIQRITGVESTQTRLGLTLVGFATAFELVVLAWSAARRGASEAVVAGVVGSYAYNVTMTLGAGALIQPLTIMDAASLHWPWIAMLAALGMVLLLALPSGRLDRKAGIVLLSAYPLFLLALIVL
jgi:cation:H+ antiporter